MPAGSPVFTVTLPQVKQLKVRCVNCAYDPAPAKIPDGVPVSVMPTYVDEDGIERPGSNPLTPIREALKNLDWKQRASGE